MSSRIKLLSLAGLLALGGCVSTQIERSAMPVTGIIRTAIVSHVRDTWKDPYSIRDAEISRAFQPQGYTGARHAVCIRANAKNSFGGYTGRQISCFAFENGVLVGGMSGAPVTAATGQENAVLGWQPFPELMR
ncbi:MAG: hypothetical protein LCH39_04060 [Proteobacteria bacterium]|nr:hypothetical protein [Pseudomonadota bacterium]